MKKLISVILAMVMLMTPFGVLADSDTSQGIEKALIAVKMKVNVPNDLTEFSNHISERNGKVFYNFDWSDEKYSQNMSVSCDSEGRITSFNHYKNTSSNKKISSFTRKEIVDFASEFILKTLPETVRGEGDVLVYNEDSYDANGNMRYSMRFERKKEGVKVKDNYAEVTVCEAEGELYVRNMYSSYNYDTEFELNAETLNDYETKFMETFPVELIYKNEYDYNVPKGMPRVKPVLVYRIKDDKIGYIDAVTGKIREEDKTEDYLLKGENSMLQDSVSGGGASREEILTPEEIEELGVVEGLLSVAEIEKSVKKLPHVVFSDELALSGSELSKNNEDKYIYRLRYNNNDENDYKYANITAEAKTGKILSLSVSSKYYEDEKELTESQVAQANVKISEFLNAAAKDDFSECRENSEDVYKYNVSKNYMRVVNGVDYVDNGITVTYDAKNKCITSYRLNFLEGEFENPEKAIGEAEAYEKILEYSPIIPLYIVNNGIYKKVFTLDCYSIQIDAVTGEIKDEYKKANRNYSYSDIEDHWVCEAAEKLSEIQVGFEGDKLNPEAPVTQKELLRFFASGIFGKYYAEYSEEDLYSILTDNKIITEEEKSPDMPVTRENAFVYVIRFAGLEKVAKLSDIYKVNYQDGHLLSEGKIGYAAILSGLGVICGNGGKLRPDRNITRAEAITVLYNYLLKL